MNRLALPAALVAILALWAPPAHAYIDGGTAAMLMQAIGAAFLGLAFTFRMWWGQAKGFVTGLFKKDAAVDHEPAD